MSVAPNLTEMLFAAGAAEQVVAVSAFSDYPEAATRLPQLRSVIDREFPGLSESCIWEGSD